LAFNVRAAPLFRREPTARVLVNCHRIDAIVLPRQRRQP